MTAFVVGLTWPMGAGKSMVAGMLRELGAKVLDADALVHDEQLRGTVGYSAIVQTFGTKVLGEDKEIDRSKLATEVFGDPTKLRRLEQILHPRVIARVLEARSMLPADAVLVVEAIKLLDGELRKACDRIWVVLAPRKVMLERLALRGIGEREAELRLAQQLTDDQFRAAADAVIVNDGDRERTLERVRDAWLELRRARD
ncbi:MAG TPA: dephospho-CoA kinase [Methylomirabilota bacterium]|nr:dephospho-CoA kinase [Methylomirabilota bacterium]